GGSRRGRLGRSVFRSTFRLELRGVKYAILAIGAYCERLGIVFEGIGRWLHAFIADLQFAVLFEKLEIDIGAGAVDAARSNIASHAQMPHICLISHRLQLTDGDVVAFVVTNACEGEPGHSGHNDDGGDDDFGVTFLSGSHGVCYMSTVLLAIWVGEIARNAE